MAMPSQYQVIHPPVQNSMGGGHMHTPQSIFQHMMGPQHTSQSTSWPQMPQVPPMMMPWCVPSSHQTQLVRFTGKKQHPEHPLCVKRKMDFPDMIENHRAKQFITEEKMAAHFQDMHISINYSQGATPSTSTASESQPSCTTSTDDSCLDLDLDATSAAVENGKSMRTRLVISEELKRLQQEPLLPASLLSKLERPSMALVLWEPPSKHLRMLSTRQDASQFSTGTSNDDENNNNNGRADTDSNTLTNNNLEDIPDMNQVTMDGESNTELELMDL